jgi:hypothetical protein
MKTNHKVTEFDPKDEKVVELLAKLKNANSPYPSAMLESRRQSFMSQMAGMGVGAAFKNAVKNGNGTGGASTTTGLLLEATLIVAIVAESIVLAYIYRDRLVDVFKGTSTTPAIQEVTSLPVITSSLPTLDPTLEIPEVSISAIPEVSISEIPTEIATHMPPGTPTPAVAESLNTNNSEAATLTGSTPNPNGNNGNNGNHYGQTPKPERTKEKDADNPGNGNGEKAPKPPKGDK